MDAFGNGGGPGIRVLFVSHATRLGGAERSLLELVRELRESGAVAPCVAAPRGDVADAARDTGVSVSPLPEYTLEAREAVRRPVETCTALWRAERALRRVAVDHRAVLLHANGQKALLPSLWAARMARIPCVWHLREYPERLTLLRRLGRGVTAAVAPSRFMEQAATDRLGLPGAGVHRIPNGVRSPEGSGPDRARMRQTLSLPENAFVVAMVAQFAPWKRHEVLVAAAARLRERGVPVQVVLAGPDGLREHSVHVARVRAAIAANNVGDRVHFLGQMADVTGVLSASDALVLPSLREPFGRVIVEAWWSGAPVVVADNGAPVELVEHERTGLHFRTDDADDLAAKLALLYRTPALGAACAAAGHLEAARYTVAEHAKGVAALYDRLMCYRLGAC